MHKHPKKIKQGKDASKIKKIGQDIESIISHENIRIFLMFHVKQSIYFLTNIIRILTSAGDTPGMREACPRVAGRIRESFCLASVERLVNDM